MTIKKNALAKNNDKTLLQEFKKFLSYDDKTGSFTWTKKSAKNIKAGQIAGCKGEHGYLLIRFNKKNHFAHRLAWLFTHGKWPQNDIDHINGVKHDNRISNLRDVSARENMQNRNSHRIGRLVGTTFNKNAKRWMAQIWINKKRTYLGYYNTEREAHDAYAKACENLKSRTDLK